MTSTARISAGAGLLLLLLLSACVAPPAPDSEGALPSAQRLLAAEFGAQATAERVDRLAAAPGALLDSLRWPTAWSRERQPLRRELGRAEALPARLQAGALAELRRHPARPGWWRAQVLDWEQDLADDLDLSMRLLATSPRPLNEISDREHRVDPQDTRPELTFWERLRRRLGL
ncbi:MAG: hypothetical protein ACON4Z_17855 [Planctomycetota bacterium]